MKDKEGLPYLMRELWDHKARAKACRFIFVLNTVELIDRDERLKVLTAFKQVETFKVLWWENKKHGVNINDKLGG